MPLPFLSVLAQIDTKAKGEEYDAFRGLLTGKLFLLIAVVLIIITLAFRRTLGAILGLLVILGFAQLALNQPGMFKGAIEFIWPFTT